MGISDILLFSSDNSIQVKDASTFVMKLKDISATQWEKVVSRVEFNKDRMFGFQFVDKHAKFGNYIQFQPFNDFIECPHARRRYQIEVSL